MKRWAMVAAYGVLFGLGVMGGIVEARAGGCAWPAVLGPCGGGVEPMPQREDPWAPTINSWPCPEAGEEVVRLIEVPQELPEGVTTCGSITMTVSDFVVVDCATGAAVPVELEPVVATWAWGAQPVVWELGGAEEHLAEVVSAFTCVP